MAVPKHRTSKQKKRQRRSHHFLKPTALMACKKCGLMKATHRMCANCGFYRGKQVMILKTASTSSNNK